MDLRSKLLIVAGGGIILISFLLLVAIPLFRSDDTGSDAFQALPNLADPSTLTPSLADNASDDSPQNQPELSDTAEDADVSMEENSQRAEIERVARLFTERFGSYSNYSNFSNLDAIESFSTQSMNTYIESTVKTEQGSNQGGTYYGVTTRILRAVIDTYVPRSTASVSISVQQELQNGLNAPIEKSIHEGRVDLLYQGGKWLVNGIFYNN